MRIGRTCRLHLSPQFQTPAMWFGLIALATGFTITPVLGQGPPGAVAAAAGAAAAASVAAPAPAAKRTAVSAAMDAAAMGNSSPSTANAADSPASAEEAANGAISAGQPRPGEATASAVPLTGVAAQCADLLKMATDLKTEVDKTNQDVLSVSVVRDAGQIEEMAKKMREQQH